MEAGAVGITCQKLGEVEVFADAGVADDILLTFNIVGEAKTERLANLIKRLKRLAVVLDNETVVRGLSAAGVRHGVDMPFPDRMRHRFRPQRRAVARGGARAGALGAEAAAHALRRADDVSQHKARDAAIHGARARSSSAARAFRFRSSRAAARRRSRTLGEFPMMTEHRAGTYVYNDVMMVTAGAATWDDCAMRVRATVVSRPTDDRAILDAGSKVLTHEQYFVKDFGRVVEYPEAAVADLSEEHGVPMRA